MHKHCSIPVHYLLLPQGCPNLAFLMNPNRHGLQYAFIIIHAGSCKHSSWAHENWWEYLLIYNACCHGQHGWPRCHAGSSDMTHQVCLVAKTEVFIEACYSGMWEEHACDNIILCAVNNPYLTHTKGKFSIQIHFCSIFVRHIYLFPNLLLCWALYCENLTMFFP